MSLQLEDEMKLSLFLTCFWSCACHSSKVWLTWREGAGRGFRFPQLNDDIVCHGHVREDRAELMEARAHCWDHGLFSGAGSREVRAGTWLNTHPPTPPRSIFHSVQALRPEYGATYMQSGSFPFS